MKGIGWSVSWLFGAAVVAIISSSLCAAAMTTIPEPTPTPEALPAGPILITAYQVNGSSLQFVQLYNNSSELVSLEGGQLVYSYASDEAGVTRIAVVASGFIEPKNHILVAVEGLLDLSAVAYHFAPTSSDSYLASIQFLSPGAAPATIPTVLKVNGTIQQRGKTATGYSTVTFSDFTGSLYADKLYEAPGPPPLKIVEISPRAKTCEPYSLDPLCGDYVKFKILPGYSDDVLSDYRLRSDDGAASVTNTFSLAHASRSGEYVLLRLRDDGQLLSLTNSGGYVWLEDSYGVVRYDETVTQYADAGSEKYIDMSWALDETTGIWKWATPSPTGTNVFPQILAATQVVSELSDCPAGKYRNPETNRCRSIEEAVSALAVCEEGKERNPLTNRCRSVVAASSTLTPCGEGEERNPATNRCRKVSGTNTELVACKTGYERSLETNRCRKSLTSAGTVTAVEPEVQGESSMLQTAILATAGVSAFGYGAYEWRRECMQFIRRLGRFIPGK